VLHFQEAEKRKLASIWKVRSSSTKACKIFGTWW